jgi:hypothetical protein
LYFSSRNTTVAVAWHATCDTTPNKHEGNAELARHAGVWKYVCCSLSSSSSNYQIKP